MSPGTTVHSSTSSLVFSLEGAELTISATSGGFSYTIEENDPQDRVVIASGNVDLNGKGSFLLFCLFNVFRYFGPYKFGKFEVRLVDDLEIHDPAIHGARGLGESLAPLTRDISGS